MKYTQAHHGVEVVPHGAPHIAGAGASIHRILQNLTVAHSVEPANLLVICRYFIECGQFFFVESEIILPKNNLAELGGIR